MRVVNKEQFKFLLESTDIGKQYLNLLYSPQVSKNKYYEKHHIHPKALGGEVSDKNNIVALTAYNHIVAHILLAKLIECPETLFAVHILSGRTINYLSDLEKITLEEVYNWSEIRERANLTNRGKHLSKEHCKKISESRKGIIFSEEHIKNLSDSHKRKTYLYDRDGNRITVPVETKQLYLDTGQYIESKLVTIHKGFDDEKVVPEIVLSRYLDEGWKVGRSEKNLQTFRTQQYRSFVSNVHKGKHLSESQKKRLSEAHKGKTLSEEHRRKLSEVKKGKHLSKEHCKKISESRKGIVFTKEHLKNLSEANKGKIYLYTPEGKRKQFNPKYKQEALQQGYIESRQIDIHKDSVGKKIPEFLLSVYIQDGWFLGHK